MMIPYCGLSLFNALLLRPESRGSGPVKIHCFFLKKINRPTVIAPIVARTIAKPIEKSKKFCKSSPFIPYTLEMNVRGSKIGFYQLYQLGYIIINYLEIFHVFLVFFYMCQEVNDIAHMPKMTSQNY